MLLLLLLCPVVCWWLCLVQAEDLRKLAEAGCAAVFMPAALYHPGSSGTAANAAMVVGASDAVDPESHETWVTVERLSQGLCAKTRPHFFRGVCTVRQRGMLAGAMPTSAACGMCSFNTAVMCAICVA